MIYSETLKSLFILPYAALKIFVNDRCAALHLGFDIGDESKIHQH